MLSLLFWGLWGFLTKISANKASPESLMALFALSSLLLSLLGGGIKLKFDGGWGWALSAGVTGALGFFFFYKALAKGPVTVVIPLTSLYIVVSSILAMLFLSEPLVFKKAVGILCAILAIILLV
jgi:transporter family protein